VVLGSLLLGLFAAAPAEPAEPAIRSVGFLVLQGVYNSELVAPYDVLHHVRFRMSDPKLAPRVFTVAKDRGPIRTFEGLTLSPDYSFEDAPAIDMLVVPSAEHNMDSDLQDKRLIEWVRTTGTRARLLLSLCDGAFVLAKAGLLDGLEATTFPGDQDRFGRMFPGVKLQRGVLFVHDGKAVTSAGGARSYEPALYVAEALYGREAALKIGQGLVIDWDLAALPHRIGPRPLWPRRP